MQIKVKEVTKRVPLLVDPEPGWMSIVNHGANQEPFNSLKSETGERNGNMAKGKAAKRNGVLTRMNFSKDNYKDEAAVQKFLDDNGISECAIEDDGDVWAAKSTSIGDMKLQKAVSTTTKHAGVTAFIAEPIEKSDDEPGDDEGEGEDDGTEGKEPVEAEGDKNKPAAKGASKAKVVDGKSTTAKGSDAKGDEDDEGTDTELRFPSAKYDYWGAMMSNEGNLMGVLKDGTDYDGLPPGMDEVLSAVYVSTGNVLSESGDVATKRTKVVQIGEDFATLTMGLFEMFEQATTDAQKSANPERKAKAAAFVESFTASIGRAAKFAGDNVIAATTTTAKGGTTVDIADATEESEEDRLARIIGKAIEPIQKRLDASDKENKELRAAMSRSTARRSDQSIIDNLVGDDEDDDGEDEAKAAQAQKLADFGSAMGYRPRSNAG